MKASKPTECLEVFPEVIVAASRDIAFGAKAYYRATTGEKLGEFAFKTVKRGPQPPVERPNGGDLGEHRREVGLGTRSRQERRPSVLPRRREVTQTAHFAVDATLNASHHRGATLPMFDPDETPQPALNEATYDRLQATLAARGPQAAVDELIAELQKAEDFAVALLRTLMKKRIELGVSPFSTGTVTELPPHTHEAYEDGIRAAGRQVGGMLPRTQRVRQGVAVLPACSANRNRYGPPCEAYTPGPDDDVYPVIEIALARRTAAEEGLRPRPRPARHLFGHHDGQRLGPRLPNPDLRDYCITKLAEALHAQLSERLRNDLTGTRRNRATRMRSIARDGGNAPGAVRGGRVPHRHVAPASVWCNRPQSTCRPGEGVNLARELLCIWPQARPEVCKAATTPPSSDNYDDYLAYLNVVAGEKVDEGLKRFEEKAAREAAEGRNLRRAGLRQPSVERRTGPRKHWRRRSGSCSPKTNAT